MLAGGIQKIILDVFLNKFLKIVGISKFQKSLYRFVMNVSRNFKNSSWENFKKIQNLLWNLRENCLETTWKNRYKLFIRNLDQFPE